eukprot:scaffold7635_cov131-Skeletonema_marinoi.AAC.1
MTLRNRGKKKKKSGNFHYRSRPAEIEEIDVDVQDESSKAKPSTSSSPKRLTPWINYEVHMECVASTDIYNRCWVCWVGSIVRTKDMNVLIHSLPSTFHSRSMVCRPLRFTRSSKRQIFNHLLQLPSHHE